ncbi:hypothetical protein [Natrinema pellirubrum]|nr:hypothetical protein [Natrinema pellirubrum]
MTRNRTERKAAVSNRLDSSVPLDEYAGAHRPGGAVQPPTVARTGVSG